MQDHHRIVITGVGVVTPIGCEKNNFWQNICNGVDGIGPLTKLDASLYDRKKAAEVKTFNQCPEFNMSNLHPLGQAVSYAIAATRMAIQDAGFETAPPHDTGVFVGTTMGNQDIVERLINKYDLKEDTSPLPQELTSELEFFKPFYLGSTLSKEFHFSGPSMVIPTACAAGNYAIGTAFSMIKQGRCKMAIAGGADPFSRTCYTIFNRLGANTPDVCKPFDQNRQGMAVGEGSAILVLEDLAHAKKRGARIYAEVKGYGLSCDAYHPTAPHPEGRGAVQAMTNALSHAKLSKEEIHYISAHGTGTKANDSCEAIAMATVFGDSLRTLPVSSIKSMLGHCMGAASAIEAVVSALAIYHQILPPTINTDVLDPSFPIPFDFVPKSRSHRIENVISNAFAFGGNVSSVVFSKLN